MRKVWISNRCGYLEPHSRSPEATGHPARKGVKQEGSGGGNPGMGSKPESCPTPSPARPDVLCVCGWWGEEAGTGLSQSVPSTGNH